MKIRGQVLVVVLWVMSLLVILAVSLAHQASVGLKFSRYQSDRIKAYGLAKAGLNSAILVVSADKGDQDDLLESWVDNEELFKDMHWDELHDGFAQVSYLVADQEEVRTVFGVIDEDRRININTASRDLLRALFRGTGVREETLADAVLAWRGDPGIEVEERSGDAYKSKGALFTAPEELLLVKGMDPNAFDKVKNRITVWGPGKVNVNTASQAVLDTLITYAQERVHSGNNAAGDLELRIRAARPFVSVAEMMDKLLQLNDLSSAQKSILNILASVVDVRSTYFRLRATGRTVPGNVVRTIESVMERDNRQVVYWHEN